MLLVVVASEIRQAGAALGRASLQGGTAGAFRSSANDSEGLTGERSAYQYAERIVKSIAWSRFDRMINRLVGDNKYTAVQLYDKFREVLSDDAIGKLVRRILRHPNGKGLRAPNRRQLKLTRTELMNTDLESL